MSRFEDMEYDEDFPNQAQMYHANTERAMKGKRGQAFLRELEAALLMLPAKKLIRGAVCKEGAVCAMGALAVKRKVDAGQKIEEALTWLEAEAPKPNEWGEGAEADATASFMEKHFNVLGRLSFEVAYANDERGKQATDEDRYQSVLEWVRSKITS